VSDEGDLVPFAVKTYRYLRLSIVVVFSALLASVFIERAQTTCWEGSISAYFYTPVLSVLTGSLVAIGVSFVAIKGRPELEDVLLNLAGVLAPVVAFVPTSRPSFTCASTDFVQADPEAFVDNNVLALVVAGVVAIVVGLIAALASRRSGDGGPPALDPSAAIGLAFAVALLVVGLGWYTRYRDSFLEHAHSVAASAMFVAIFAAIVVNVVRARGAYRRIYATTAITMVLVLVGTTIGGWVADDWRHRVLWLELFELIPVTVFWAVQTVELWNGGVRPRRPPSPSPAAADTAP
jgi:hypothetical protein